jgi:SAM-dependent methyltransferase
MPMSPRPYLRFPAACFRSMEAFQRFQEDSDAELGERRRQEGVFAEQERLDGTCGVCLRVTTFEPGGPAVADWRVQQICGCEARLASHQRALLQAAAPRFGRTGWCRAGLFGRDEAILRALAPRLPGLVVWPDLRADAAGRPALPAETASAHLVLSADHLAVTPAPEAALAEIARVLMPGGVFLCTLPFAPDAATTNPAPPRRFGWDILDRARAAGFQDGAVHGYWSAELGYLGPDNMILTAFR